MTAREFFRLFAEEGRRSSENPVQPGEGTLEDWITSDSMRMLGSDCFYLKVAGAPSESNYAGIEVLHCPNCIDEADAIVTIIS